MGDLKRPPLSGYQLPLASKAGIIFAEKSSRQLIDENQAVIVERLEVKKHQDMNAAFNIKVQSTLKLKAEGLSVSANGGKHQSGHASVAA